MFHTMLIVVLSILYASFFFFWWDVFANFLGLLCHALAIHSLVQQHENIFYFLMIISEWCYVVGLLLCIIMFYLIYLYVAAKYPNKYFFMQLSITMCILCLICCIGYLIFPTSILIFFGFNKHFIVCHSCYFIFKYVIRKLFLKYKYQQQIDDSETIKK